jgi:hypothetical protein
MTGTAKRSGSSSSTRELLYASDLVICAKVKEELKTMDMKVFRAQLYAEFMASLDNDDVDEAKYVKVRTTQPSGPPSEASCDAS